MFFVTTREARIRRQSAAEEARLGRYNRLLLESTGEGIYGVDLDGRCTFLNDAGARMIGVPAADAVGRKMHDLTHHHRPDGSVYPVEECPIYRVYKDGQGCRIADEVFFRADGTSFPVEYTSNPIRSDGHAEGAVVTFTDVTQRKADERLLAETGERFRDLADNIPQLAWMADGGGQIFWYNQRWFDYTGSTLEQMRGSGWRAAHHPEHVEAVAAKFAASVRSRDGLGGHVPPPPVRRRVLLVPVPGRPHPGSPGGRRPVVRDQHRRHGGPGDGGGASPQRGTPAGGQGRRRPGQGAGRGGQRVQEPVSWPT